MNLCWFYSIFTLFHWSDGTTVGARSMTLFLPGNTKSKIQVECISWHLDFWNYNKKQEAPGLYQGVLQVYFLELSEHIIHASLTIDSSYASNFNTPKSVSKSASKGFLYQHTDIPIDAREQVETHRKNQLENDNPEFDYENDPLAAKICFKNYNTEDKKVVFKILQMEDPGVPDWIRRVARNPDWQLHDEFWLTEPEELTETEIAIKTGLNLDPELQHLISNSENENINRSKIEIAQVQAHLATNEIRVSLEYIKRKLTMSMMALEQRKYDEKRDRNLMELLHTKVNTRGWLYSILICISAALSTMIIKMFFALPSSAYY